MSQTTTQDTADGENNNLVIYHVENSIAHITLNDKKNLNAFSMTMKHKVLEALNKADDDDDVRVIVLQGANGHFSSGGDIKEMLADGIDKEAIGTRLKMMVKGAGEISLLLRNIHKPIIAKLEGAVAGSGMNVALTCDFRITANNAKFVQGFINLGLIPDAGGIYLLNELVGSAKAAELVMLGDRLTADDMARLNLVNQVVTLEELDDATLALANRLAALPNKALASMKHMLNVHAYSGLNEALDMEIYQQFRMTQTDDFIEGITAFIEKRKPVYNLL